MVLGIRREEKAWERRVALTPADVQELINEHDLKVIVQSSTPDNSPYPRIFTDDEYRAAGALVQDDLSECGVILGIKEIPIPHIAPEKVHMYFTHTIKGQRYNMAMLRYLLDNKCTALDYETVTDDQNRRLIFFGKFAGLAGMIDTLWALGQRLRHEGYETSLAEIKLTHEYASLQEAKDHIHEIGQRLKIPAELRPFTVGFAGYGNVSQGAQEIFDLLPHEKVSPQDILTLTDTSKNVLYKIVFKEIDTVKPKDPNHEFELMDYFRHPQQYESQFAHYVPYLTTLVNCIFWTEENPYLITKEQFKDFYENKKTPLRVIGDISCDIEGAIEATVKATKPDNPVFVYHPVDGTHTDGFIGEGPVIMAVDNLPCELSRDASETFSHALKPFVKALVSADYRVPFSQLELPPELKGSVIVYQGQLTPDYEYMNAFLI